MLRQVGALVKTNNAESPLADLDVKHAYLGGYSQSGVDTATFATAFNATTFADGAAVYDGYLIGARRATCRRSSRATRSSRSSSGRRCRRSTYRSWTSSRRPTSRVSPWKCPRRSRSRKASPAPTQIDTPTFTYVNVGGAKVRRADSDTDADRYRLYEIPGAPHVGNGDSCDGVSSFPTRSFTRAAAARLACWAEDGVAPPEAPRIDLTTRDDVSVTGNDEHGNALGGIRSPFVDVPLFRYAVHGSGPFCILSGNETSLGGDVLTPLYGDEDGYLGRVHRVPRQDDQGRLPPRSRPQGAPRHASRGAPKRRSRPVRPYQFSSRLARHGLVADGEGPCPTDWQSSVTLLVTRQIASVSGASRRRRMFDGDSGGEHDENSGPSSR